MNVKRLTLLAAFWQPGFRAAAFLPAHAQAADAAALQPKDGWYGKLVQFDALRPLVDIPPVKGVMIIDSRPKRASTIQAIYPARSTFPTRNSTRWSTSCRPTRRRS